MRRLLLAFPFLAIACAEAPQGGTQAAPPGGPQGARWSGEMRCAQIPGLTTGTLRSPVTVTVSGGVARYAREVQTVTGQAAGRGEAGEGRVGPDGSVTLEGRVGAASGGGGSYAARYAGRLAGEAATLQGTQDWTTGSGPFQRPCTITLRRG